MIVVVMIITAVVIAIPVSMVAVDIDHNRGRNRITARFAVHRRWRAIYRHIIHRPFTVDR
jgi:hypothetical protein